jgi:two-component system, NtrC family, nitrogen regulation response regulator NtrX
MPPGAPTVLVVDDEPNIRKTLRMVLESEGWGVLDAGTAEEAEALLQSEPVGVAIFDIKLPGTDGLTLLSRARQLWRDLPVIVISGHADAPEIGDAMKRGAYGFLQKPLERERVIVTVRSALEWRHLKEGQRTQAARETRFDDMVGESPAMLRLREEIAKVAPTRAPVLVLGESGTGKELIAEELHRRSRRAAARFEKVNCAAIPSELIESELFGHEKGSFSGAGARRVGRFELADGGTLFLDEIGDMSPAAQAKVLRALENAEITRVGGEKAFTVDVRIIAATNQDLDAMVRAGAFREDLLHRLKVVPLHAPPLRERLSDLPALVDRFVTLAARRNDMRSKVVEPAVLERLAAYHWPGNVRELRNVCERLLIMSGDRIRLADVPADLGPRPGGGPASGTAGGAAAHGEVALKDLRDLVERDYILKKLEEHDWNVTQAAQALGIERTNLHKKIKQHGLARGRRGGAEDEGRDADG